MFCLATRFRVSLPPIGEAASVRAIDKRLAHQRHCLFGLHVAWETSTLTTPYMSSTKWTVLGARLFGATRIRNKARLVIQLSKSPLPEPEEH